MNKETGLTYQVINERKEAVLNEIAPKLPENNVVPKRELKIKFKDLDDSYFGDAEKIETIKLAEMLYGIKMTEVTTGPDVTVHYGGHKAIYNQIEGMDSKDFIKNGEPSELGKLSSKQFTTKMSIALGSKGVSVGLGKEVRNIFICSNPYSKRTPRSLMSKEQRIKTTVHELGHALGLNHPLVDNNNNNNNKENIMHQAKFEGNLQELKATRKQKDIVRDSIAQRRSSIT